MTQTHNLQIFGVIPFVKTMKNEVTYLLFGWVVVFLSSVKNDEKWDELYTVWLSCFLVQCLTLDKKKKEKKKKKKERNKKKKKKKKKKKEKQISHLTFHCFWPFNC